jgi:hypothetical protein
MTFSVIIAHIGFYGSLLWGLIVITHHIVYREKLKVLSQIAAWRGKSLYNMNRIVFALLTFVISGVYLYG